MIQICENLKIFEGYHQQIILEIYETSFFR